MNVTVYGTLFKQDLDYLTAQLKKPCPADLAPEWQASLGRPSADTVRITTVLFVAWPRDGLWRLKPWTQVARNLSELDGLTMEGVL